LLGTSISDPVGFTPQAVHGRAAALGRRRSRARGATHKLQAAN
jgi:hypothetical protein